jgi:hypothetical protein
LKSEVLKTLSDSFNQRVFGCKWGEATLGWSIVLWGGLVEGANAAAEFVTAGAWTPGAVVVALAAGGDIPVGTGFILHSCQPENPIEPGG